MVNKWDVGRKDVLEQMPGQNPMTVFSEELRDAMHFMAYAPLAFTSAVTGKGVTTAVEAALGNDPEFNSSTDAAFFGWNVEAPAIHGVVAEVLVKPGDQIDAKDLLVRFE